MFPSVSRRLKNKIVANEFWTRLFKNAFMALTGTAGANLIGIVTLSVLVQSLGVTQYALFVLAQQYMTIVDALVNFQSWQAVIKFGADAKVHDDAQRLLSNIKSGITLDLVTALAGFAVACLLVNPVGDLLSWDAELRLAALLFSAEIVFHIEGSSTGVLRLFDKFHWTATNSIVFALLKLVGISAYAFLFPEHTLLGYVAVYAVVDACSYLSLLIMALMFIKKRYGLMRMVKTSRKNTDRGFVRFCVWANIGSAVDVPVKYLDVFIISAVSVEMVAVYKVYKQVLQVFSLLVNPISTAIMPQMSELVSQGKQNGAFDVVLKIRNVIALVMLGSIALAAIFGKPLFSIFFGMEYSAHLPLFLMLVLVHFYALMYVALHPFFFSLGFAKQDSLITLVSNAVYLLLAFLLVGTMGIYAIVLAMACQYVITNTSKLFFARKALGKPLVAIPKR